MKNTKDYMDIDEWFVAVVAALKKIGIRFTDIDSVRDDYHNGTSVEEMAEIIRKEYED